MSPKKIEKLLNRMLSLSGNNPEKIQMTWKTISNLKEFFSGEDAERYIEDPMSEYAPSECFSLEMKRWKILEDAITHNLSYAERIAKEFREECNRSFAMEVDEFINSHKDEENA